MTNRRRTLIAALSAAPLVALAQSRIAPAGHRPDPAVAKRVLLIGIDPAYVDYSAFPGLDAVTLAAMLAAQLLELQQLGYDAQWCFIDTGLTAELKPIEVMRASRFGAVLIGAGVRQPASNFLLFERLINAVHAHAFGAKICFNEDPSSTTKAILRWV